MENQTTTTRTALKWGVIIGIILVLNSTAIYVTGQIGNEMWGYLSLPITGFGVFFSLRDFKKENQGFMSFSQGLGLGTMMSAITGLILSFYTIAYNKYIDTSLNEQSLKIAVQKLEQKGIPDDQIEQSMEMMKMVTSPGIMFISILIGIVFVGFIFSLIISAILKKEKAVFE